MSEYVAAYNALNGLKDYQPAEDNRDDRDLPEQAIQNLRKVQFRHVSIGLRSAQTLVRAVVDRKS